MIIADTGFWLTPANRRDRQHPAARRAAEGLDEPLITTWPVLTETCHLRGARLGPLALGRFLESVARGAVQLFDLGPEHLPRVLTLVRKYGELPMDLADASLVILAEELGSGRILFTDQRDFRTHRWKSRKPFHNLMDSS